MDKNRGSERFCYQTYCHTGAVGHMEPLKYTYINQLGMLLLLLCRGSFLLYNFNRNQKRMVAVDKWLIVDIWRWLFVQLWLQMGNLYVLFAVYRFPLLFASVTFLKNIIPRITKPAFWAQLGYFKLKITVFSRYLRFLHPRIVKTGNNKGCLHCYSPQNVFGPEL